MTRLLFIFVTILLFSSCERIEPIATPPSKMIRVECRFLKLEPTFFERFGMDLENAPAILTDIESFFLFEKDPSERVFVYFKSGESVRVLDTVKAPDGEFWITVTGTVEDESVRIEVVPTVDSGIVLTEPVTVVLPRNYSAIIQTATHPVENRKVFIWLINATE